MQPSPTSPSLRADYHFHPNLPKDDERARAKVRRIFEALREYGVGVVVVSEHVYKDPRRAWRMMNEQKPDDITLVPGVEYVTREDIDMIVFARDERIYDHPELAPFSMSYREAVQFIGGQPHLHAFVTHPFTLGRTGIVSKHGVKFTQAMIEALGAVEVAYSAFDRLYRPLRFFPLRRMRQRAFKRLALNDYLPEEFLMDDMKFFAAGSDAHHTWDIGGHIELPMPGSGDVFHALTHNKGGPVMSYRSDESYSHSAADVLTTWHEWYLKRRVKAKMRRRAKSGAAAPARRPA